jgi:hypothetical protein
VRSAMSLVELVGPNRSDPSPGPGASPEGLAAFAGSQERSRFARAAGARGFAALQVSRPFGRDFYLQLNEQGGAARRRHLQPRQARRTRSRKRRSCELPKAALLPRARPAGPAVLDTMTLLWPRAPSSS